MPLENFIVDRPGSNCNRLLVVIKLLRGHSNIRLTLLALPFVFTYQESFIGTILRIISRQRSLDPSSILHLDLSQNNHGLRNFAHCIMHFKMAVNFGNKTSHVFFITLSKVESHVISSLNKTGALKVHYSFLPPGFEHSMPRMYRWERYVVKQHTLIESKEEYLLLLIVFLLLI